jgi:hypothetical protein
MLLKEVIIINKLGLHARASAKLTRLAINSRVRYGLHAMAVESMRKVLWV